MFNDASATQRPGLAYVVNSLEPGGAEKLVVAMAQAFSVDYRVVVICLDQPGPLAQTLRSSGIDVICVWRQPGLDAMLPAKLAGLFRRYRIDVIHAHQGTAWFYSALSRLLNWRPRLVFHEHGRFYPEVPSAKRRLVHRHLIRRLTHSVVAVSEDVRAALVKYEGFDAGDVSVIYNGIHPVAQVSSQDRRQMRASMGFGDSEFVVGTVGRLDAIKNLPLFVNAMTRVMTVQPNTRALMIGDGPERERLQSLVGEQPNASSFQFAGYRPDANRWTQCLDAFVLCSFNEGTSLALLEAMSSGVPVVVTGVGGNPELVIHDNNGLVVESDNVVALSKAISTMAVSGRTRREFVAAGRVRFQNTFRAAQMIQSFRRLYWYQLGVVQVFQPSLDELNEKRG